MPFFRHRPAANEPVLPSYTSSQGSITQAGSAPSEPPPAYALYSSSSPPGLLPHWLRSRLNGRASSSTVPPCGADTQAGTPSASPASDQMQSVTLQARSQSVQVRPHEFLSFERLQRVMGLPGFKGSNEDLDALTAGPDHVASDSYISNNRRCKPRPIKFDGLKAHSYYRSSKPQCLVLTTWSISSIFMDRSHCSSRAALQDVLRDLDIKLCPHKKFDDPWIVELLYRMAHRDEKLADPLDQWEADANLAIDATGHHKARCQHCSTC